VSYNLTIYDAIKKNYVKSFSYCKKTHGRVHKSVKYDFLWKFPIRIKKLNAVNVFDNEIL
jgi:hypothetical protein